MLLLESLRSSATTRLEHLPELPSSTVPTGIHSACTIGSGSPGSSLTGAHLKISTIILANAMREKNGYAHSELRVSSRPTPELSSPPGHQIPAADVGFVEPMSSELQFAGT